MEYHLNLVGLQVVLQTPMEITIAQRLEPFLCRSGEKVQCTITLQEAPELPKFSPDGVWNGPEYYDRIGYTQRIFHCTAPAGEAFAVTQLEQKEKVTITVLPGYLSYFAGSSGIFNRIGMETLLLQHKGLLLHASLIDYEGKGIAFTGPSGVGKSTQAELWHTCCRAEILNGDRAALRQTSEGWMAYGSPYAGTSGIYRSGSVPLKAIVVLRQGKENKLCRMKPSQALSSLLPELSLHRWDKHFMGEATDLCLELLQSVPVYLLECLPEESAVERLKKGLFL